MSEYGNHDVPDLGDEKLVRVEKTYQMCSYAELSFDRAFGEIMQPLSPAGIAHSQSQVNEILIEIAEAENERIQNEKRGRQVIEIVLDYSGEAPEDIVTIL